jgi:L-lactate utilization protein LutC
MTQTPTSSESGTRLYNDLEIDLLIEDLTEAAEEAIERAAAEAAKAAALASLEREAAAIREAARQQAEVIRWQSEAEAAKRNGIKNAVIAGVVCFLGGLAVGAGTILIFEGR